MAKKGKGSPRPAEGAASHGFWKPGQASPAANRSPTASSGSGKSGGKKRRRSTGDVNDGKGQKPQREEQGAEQHKTKHQQPQKKRGKRDVEPVKDFSKRRGSEGMTSGLPSKSLLAMKFMKRKADAEDDALQASAKQAELDRDFDTVWARNLNKQEQQQEQRLVCVPDVPNPLEVIVARRSFNGFRPAVEQCYKRCVDRIKGAAQSAASQGSSSSSSSSGGSKRKRRQEQAEEELRRQQKEEKEVLRKLGKRDKKRARHGK